MRPIEAVLSAANVLAFFSLILPLPAALQGFRLAAPAALLIAVVQMIAEGARWQMFPAYLLAGMLFLIWLTSRLTPEGLSVSRWVAGAGVGLGILGLLVSVALPLVLPVFRFPQPSGPYAIGTLSYHWTGTGRPELFTSDSDDQRELMAQVWYPAGDTSGLPPAPYIMDADAVAPALARLTRLPAFLFTHFRYVTTHAAVSAPIADDQPLYPVLIFLSGLGGFRQVNTFQIEELVSYGYIVVGLDQPGAVALVQFPDGRQVAGLKRDELHPLVVQSVEPQPDTPTLFGEPLPEGIVPYFAADVSFALDQLEMLNNADPNGILTGRLDLEQAGIFGISLGGINAAEACLRDGRLKACLIMDVYMSSSVVAEGLQQPAMWITRDAETMRFERERAGGWLEHEILLHQRTMRAVYESLPGDGYYLQIPDMFHLNLTDFPYWSPLWPQIGLTGPVSGQRIFEIVNAYSVAFFDQHLRGQPAALLTGPSSQYPEVNFESRHQPQP